MRIYTWANSSVPGARKLVWVNWLQGDPIAAARATAMTAGDVILAWKPIGDPQRIWGDDPCKNIVDGPKPAEFTEVCDWTRKFIKALLPAKPAAILLDDEGGYLGPNASTHDGNPFNSLIDAWSNAGFPKPGDGWSCAVTKFQAEMYDRMFSGPWGNFNFTALAEPAIDLNGHARANLRGTVPLSCPEIYPAGAWHIDGLAGPMAWNCLIIHANYLIACVKAYASVWPWIRRGIHFDEGRTPAIPIETADKVNDALLQICMALSIQTLLYFNNEKDTAGDARLAEVLSHPPKTRAPIGTLQQIPLDAESFAIGPYTFRRGDFQ